MVGGSQTPVPGWGRSRELDVYSRHQTSYIESDQMDIGFDAKDLSSYLREYTLLLITS